MKKFAAIALTLAMTASAACAGATTVGICQLVQHEALDAATQGFKDALTEKMPDVKFDEQNAAGDAANCVTITSKFAADGVDLILANATAPLQAAVSATGEIPILGTSITDYATALGMKDWNGTTGINVSGTSDLAPLDGQAAIIKELFPDAKNVGLVYCSAEANSIYQITVIKGYLEEMGYACTEFAFTDSNDVASVTQSAADASDVIYIPTDNTAAAYTETIANVLIPAKVPAVVGEEGFCRGEKRTLRWGISNMERDMYREQLRTLGLGLEERMSSKVGLLSGGQRQALTLLMAALRTPKLLLLDEHTAALDPKTAAKVLELTEKIVAEQKLTAMMVTHNMKDAIAMGNRLIMMNAGRIVVDVRGEEKKKLTREDLMQLFEKAAGQEIENDRMLLS